jgi:hypothetical protein
MHHPHLFHRHGLAIENKVRKDSGSEETVIKSAVEAAIGESTVLGTRIDLYVDGKK